MSLSRKRRKELNRLRKSADELWSNQQAVLDHANAIAREAGRQAGVLTREEVVPRVREGYEQYLLPGVQATQHFAGDAKRRLVSDVIPGISSGVGAALGTVLSVGDIAKDTRVPLETLHDVVDPMPGPDMRAQAQQDMQRLLQAMAALPLRTRQVFQLCRFEGMSYQQAAEHLAISTSSVQKHLAMAVSFVAQKMEHRG